MNTYVGHPFQSPAVLSFCPGFLGLERGLERAIGPVRVAAYAEIEAFICANLIAGMEAGVLAPAPVWTDLKTFPARLFHGKIHGILGGYRCQPFSAAGKQRGEADPRHLWPYLREITRIVGPAWCFFENVANHLNLGYRTVRQELEDLGYHVEEGIYSAEEVGATHRRERLFILAVANADGVAVRSLFPCHKRERNDSERNKTDRATRLRGASMADTNDYARRLAGEERPTLSETGGGCEIVADTNSKRGQLSPERHQPAVEEFISVSPYRIADRFPMGQGPEQFDWEAPRTIEPGVGCTVNGYNFREDLLRAYGNSVVEQTAELAFRTLLQKQIDFFELNELLG